MSSANSRSNVLGGAWLVADMGLNIFALSLVKLLGLSFPPAQTVFLRAAVGLVVILPWVWTGRRHFASIPDAPLQLLRVALSTLALWAGFFAIARVPLALFTAVNFTRPVLTMVLAALLLGEVIGWRRWLAAAVALLGVFIAINPFGGAITQPAGQAEGLPALFLAVIAGTLAIIVLRRLRATPALVLMTFYTGGLALATAPFAAVGWQPPATGEWTLLLAIGLFAQAAQVCFLRAHYLGEAGYLSVLSYASIILSATVGVMVFDEPLTLPFVAGAALVIGAALWVTRAARSGG